MNSKIESWMFNLEFSMKHAVAKVLIECCKAYDQQEFKLWISNWPTQFILVALEVNFTERLTKLYPAQDHMMVHMMTGARVRNNAMS